MTDALPDTSNPFRRAVLRGLGIVLPPLLTVLLFNWAWKTIDQYALVPVEQMTRLAMVWTISDVHDEPVEGAVVHTIRGNDGEKLDAFQNDGTTYVRLPRGQFIPHHVYRRVSQDPGEVRLSSANAYYHRYARIHWLKRTVVVPVFFCVFILLLYILGKFFAAGMGRIIWNGIEAMIVRLPVIRNVYSSVKQVTDFMFSETEIEFNRVVAVEYPRKGIWSVGFVTGESMLDIRAAANEAVLTVLMPTSPMPATGFTVTVLKSETIDIDISMDQAIQFVVSCGVVVPLQQQQMRSEISSRITAAIGDRTAAALESQTVDSPQNGGGKRKSSSENGNGSAGPASSSSADGAPAGEKDSGIRDNDTPK
jgi:uncharacterized membrane protein